jgi:D-glycero-alpha-D-manno-heptose 1-phosphate guanylyltransferase
MIYSEKGGFRNATRSSEDAGLKAVLLVGGMGTRLRTVIDSTPKSLAPIGNRPFLELLVRQLAHQGIGRVVMCTGYLADQIEGAFGDGSAFGITIEYSREQHALGTAGAVKFAQRLLEGLPYFVVMNGDSFLDIDFDRLIQAHRFHRGLATIAVVSVENAARYGTVRVNSDNKITEFCEKTGHDCAGLINGGMYLFNSAILDHIPSGPASLERDVFPNILTLGVYAMKHEGMFIDIGTPADYSHARLLFGVGEQVERPKT